MARQTWVTMWEQWRDLMGTPSSAVRKELNKKLQTRPCMLYWGDSWFSTPLYLNLARNSMRSIDGIGILIGKPGAQAERLFTPSEVKDKVGRLERWPFDIVCLSAGGNDALSDRLAEVFKARIKPGKPGTMTANQAYQQFLAANIFTSIVGSYSRLLDEIGSLIGKPDKSHIRVISHSYCKIVRLGAPADLTIDNIGLIAWLKGETGPWLWNVMQHVVTDRTEGQKFADKMIDGFKADVMGVLESKYGFFKASDFHDLPEPKSPSFWNDEIHPTEAGFATLAKRFNADLKVLLPTGKQAAVP